MLSFCVFVRVEKSFSKDLYIRANKECVVSSFLIYIGYRFDHRKDGARVTTRIKKVTGDRDLFLNELRAALQIPIPKNPRDDTIRIRTGGTIEIKGNRVLEVKTWLASL